MRSLDSPLPVDDAHQVPVLSLGLKDQLEGGPVHSVVHRVGAGEAEIHKAAVRIGLGEVLQGVARSDDAVHPDLRGLGVVLVVDVPLNILGRRHFDGAAPAVLKAPGVDVLVLAQIFDLVRGEVQVGVQLHGGVGGEGHAPLRVDVGGQGGPALPLEAPVHGAGRVQQGEVVRLVQDRL